MRAKQRSLKDLFLAALDVAPPERAAWLEQICGQDPELRLRVELMLAAHDKPESLFDRLAQAAARPELASDPLAAAAPKGVSSGENEESGVVLAGQYKLVEQIGEGGMGTVWMAQQIEPVKRLVAVKLIKAGMDSKHVIARFEAERQALALMDHPNIAKVHDAGQIGGASRESNRVEPGDGTRELGLPRSPRPYFVMELVKGVPITKYCDAHRLTPRQRLELFVPICQAVQHAHQKGIIHRDLKPSNVLVALYDGRPVPKVIDFGIAKAAGEQLTERTLITGFGTIVGTIEYMSPEQAELNQLDVDTRSDVYSLGVLLYELLTGTTPLDRAHLKQTPFTELLRMVREEEPRKPSTRLSESKDTLASISTQRQMEPAKLTRLVRGELDWIVMKTLEKDRRRRYETANGLAMDVQRYLNDEPVAACPPSAWYRFGKVARRHKASLAVAGVVLFCIALLGGGVGWVVRDRAVRQVRAANELELALDRVELFQGQGKRAQAAAALERAEMLAGEAATDLDRSERVAGLKERLAADARDQAFIARFEDIRLRAQSRVDVKESRFTWETALPEIRDALRRYGIEIRVMASAQAAARIQDRPEPVRRDLLAAMDECLRWVPKEDAQTWQWLLATLAAADNDAWRVRVRKAMAGRDTKALAQLAREADVPKQPPTFLLVVAETLPPQMRSNRLELLRRAQRAYPADLWTNHGLAVELLEHGQPAEASRYFTAALALRPDNPGIYLNRGRALRAAREVDAAIADFCQSLALAPRYAEAHMNLGSALHDKGRVDEAIAEYHKAIQLKDHPEAHNNLGIALRTKGRLDEAIAEFREAIRINKDYYEAHCNLAIVLHSTGRQDEAIAEFREAIRINKDYYEAHCVLAIVLNSTGRLDEAIAEFREGIRIKKDMPVDHNNLGTVLGHKGQLDEAIVEFREAIRLKKDYTVAHYNLGHALHRKGQLDEAIVEYREAIRLKNDYQEAHNNLGRTLLAKGQRDRAIFHFSRAIELGPKQAKGWSDRGDAYRLLGQYDKALKDYETALKLAPTDAGVLTLLAWMLATCPDTKRRDPAWAVKLAKKAVQLTPRDSDPWNTLGVARYRAGDWKAAIVALDTSVKLSQGGTAVDFFFLAMAHGKLGRSDDARKWYDKAVAWLTQNKETLEKDKSLAEELRRFRSEAEGVLKTNSEKTQK